MCVCVITVRVLCAVGHRVLFAPRRTSPAGRSARVAGGMKEIKE